MPYNPQNSVFCAIPHTEVRPCHFPAEKPTLSIALGIDSKYLTMPDFSALISLPLLWIPFCSHLGLGLCASQSVLLNEASTSPRDILKFYCHERSARLLDNIPQRAGQL